MPDTKRLTTVCLTAGLIVCCLTAHAGERYSIEAIRMATLEALPMSILMEGADEDATIDAPVFMWLLRSDDRTILFDAGFHNADRWGEYFTIADFIRPDKAVERAGVSANDITDIIISHVHWDHMEGAFLFPNARLWIQREELEFYAGRGFHEEARHVEIEEMVRLIRKNAEGKVELIEGDDVEIMPGLRVYIGGRHTFASQYLLVENEENWVLASDNAYLYRNIEDLIPIGITLDKEQNLAAIKRMIELAGDTARILPGHDPEVLDRYPSTNGVTTIVGDAASAN